MKLQFFEKYMHEMIFFVNYLYDQFSWYLSHILGDQVLIRFVACHSYVSESWCIVILLENLHNLYISQHCHKLFGLKAIISYNKTDNCQIVIHVHLLGYFVLFGSS